MLKGKQLQLACESALAKAGDLLEIGWTKTWAQDDKGNSCEPQDEKACAWCLEGALMAATFYQHPDEAERKQVIETCMTLIQTSNKEFHPYLKANKYKIENSGSTLTGSRISKWSVIPKLNDSIASGQAQVVSWVRMGLRLAKMDKVWKDD